MKVMSLNARGIGSHLKQKAIRQKVNHEKVEMLFLQEIKMPLVDVNICRAVWGDAMFDWKVSPAVNQAGGLLCIWKKGFFALSDWFEGAGFLGLVGVWGGN